MKRVEFLGDTRAVLRGFPEAARRMAGFELDRVQRGLEPTSWKPMPSIGAGVQEIRVRQSSGAFRVIYVAKFSEAIFVLHAFQKKTQRTPQRDLKTATQRLSELLKRVEK